MSNFNPECICDDLIFYEECVICLKSFPDVNTQTFKNKCKVHRPMFCCGYTEFICCGCKSIGWYSTAGTGRSLIPNVRWELLSL